MKSSPYKYTRFLSIQILFLSSLFSCNNKQVPPTLSGAASPNNPPQILYITLEAVKDTVTNTLQIKLIQQVIVNGTLKTGNNIRANTQRPIVVALDGNQISLVEEKKQSAGIYSLPFTLQQYQLAAGTYFIVFSVNGNIVAKELVKLK